MKQMLNEDSKRKLKHKLRNVEMLEKCAKLAKCKSIVNKFKQVFVRVKQKVSID